MTTRALLAFACVLALASAVAGQAPPQAPEEAPAPAAEDDAPQAPQTSPAAPADAGAPPAAPSAATEQAAQPQPPQDQPPVDQPAAALAAPGQPPPPRYGKLGGDPEPEQGEGDWDPWEHATPETRRHDGFYLRFTIGLGGGSVSGDDHIAADVDEVTVSGMGLAGAFAIGGAVTDNLIINADLYGFYFFDPSVEQDGESVPAFDAGVSDDMRIGGIGLGVTYYFMPINLYLAGSIGLAEVVFEDDRGDSKSTDIGFGANLMVGKEWWVGPDWGLGIAGQLLLVSTDDYVLGDVGALAASVLFSATYN